MSSLSGSDCGLLANKGSGTTSENEEVSEACAVAKGKQREK